MAVISKISSGIDSFIQLVWVLLIFIFVLIVTYFVTKWIAGYQKGRTYNKNLKIIDTIKLTTNKYIQIVEVGDEYLVIAIGKDEITLLTKLTKEQLEIRPEDSLLPEYKDVGESFADVLEKLKKHLPKKQEK